MNPLYAASLDVDIQPWKAALAASGRSAFAVDDIKNLLKSNLRQFVQGQEPKPVTSTVFNAVLIRNNTWYFPFREYSYKLGCDGKDWCSSSLAELYRAFTRWAKDVAFPDALFIVDDRDSGGCQTGWRCPVPTFAFSKQVRRDGISSKIADKGNGQGSILIPSPQYLLTSPGAEAGRRTWPWGQKERKLYYKSCLACPAYHQPPHPPPGARCAREFMSTAAGGAATALAELAKSVHATSRTVSPWEVCPPPDVAEAVKYLLPMALDGEAGGGLGEALAALLHGDSPVVAEYSPWVEYFTRGLTEGVHYLPAFKTGPADAVDLLRLPDERLQAVAAEGQRFAATFLCDKAMMLYFHKAVVEYKALFGDAMDHFITSDVVPLLALKQRVGMGSRPCAEGGSCL